MFLTSSFHFIATGSHDTTLLAAADGRAFPAFTPVPEF